MLSMLDFQASRWLMSREIPPQAGNNHPTGIPTGVFETKDGHINIAAAGDEIYERFCRAIERPDLRTDPRFATALFDGMRGMGRLWQAAGTVASVLRPGLLEKAVAAGLRSLFVGFETLNPAGLRAQGKVQNLHRDYNEAVRRLHGLGVMVNGSFVFGMDEDDASVFDRTVGWAIEQGIETATFHILTPYPGTALYGRMEGQGRILHRDWDLYDTRHVVFETRGMKAEELEAGYWRAYRDFYRWGSIFRGASAISNTPNALHAIRC